MVDEERWGIIYCPRNGYLGNYQKQRRILEQILQLRLVSYDIVQSENPRSVERLVRLLVSNGYKTIIIYGGDSALNDEVNYLMLLEPEKRDSITVGVIPNGVLNDFAHFWGFDESHLEQTIVWLKQKRIRRIDIGYIRYENKKCERCRRYFLNCVNIGMVANIMSLRRRMRHLFISRTISFILSCFLLLFQRMDYLMSLNINTDSIRRRLMTVCIGNAQGYGQTPNAVPYNGLLDVSIVSQPKMLQAMKGMYLLLRDKILNHQSVLPYRTQELRAQVTSHTPVSVDGRLLKSAPVGTFIIGVEKEVINFIIPN